MSRFLSTAGDVSQNALRGHAHPPKAHTPQACTPPDIHPPRHACPLDTMRCRQWAGHTHPTGMHSCGICDHFLLHQDHFNYILPTNLAFCLHYMAWNIFIPYHVNVEIKNLEIFGQRCHSDGRWQKLSLIWVFPKCFHWIIQWQKILCFKKIIWNCHLLYKISKCYRSASKTYIADRIFILSPIHASVIYQIPWIHWILIHLGKTPL